MRVERGAGSEGIAESRWETECCVKAQDRKREVADRVYMLTKIPPPKQKWVTLGRNKATSGQQKSDLIKCSILKRKGKLKGLGREDALRGDH